MAKKIIPWVYCPENSDTFEAWECRSLNGNSVCTIVKEDPDSGYYLYFLNSMDGTPDNAENAYDHLDVAKSKAESVLKANGYILADCKVKALL